MVALLLLTCFIFTEWPRSKTVPQTILFFLSEAVLTFKSLTYHLMKMLKHNYYKRKLLSKVGMLLFALRKIRFLLFFSVKPHLEKEKKNSHGSRWTSLLLMLPHFGKWSFLGLLRNNKQRYTIWALRTPGSLIAAA